MPPPAVGRLDIYKSAFLRLLQCGRLKEPRPMLVVNRARLRLFTSLHMTAALSHLVRSSTRPTLSAGAFLGRAEAQRMLAQAAAAAASALSLCALGEAQDGL